MTGMDGIDFELKYHKKYMIMSIRILLFILSTITLATWKSFAQCPTGFLEFTTQSEVDNFSVNFPDCENIQGNVVIKGSDIIDLTPLSQIKKIEGYLEITSNPLNSLHGLHNITHVEDYLTVSGNPELTDLSGLASLEYVGNSFIIHNHANLSNIQHLQNLSYIGGYFEMGNLSELTSLQGLESLGYIGDNFILNNLPKLQSIGALLNLTEVGNYISISNNPLLTSLAGLENLSKVGDNFYITLNNNLTSLQALSNLNDIGGTLSIEYNPALTNLNGLENLTTISGDLRIAFNSNLSSISSLSNVSQIDGSIWINNNSQLNSCTLNNICDFILNHDNAVNIYNNGGECADYNAVIYSCNDQDHTGPGTGFITTWITTNTLSGSTPDNQIRIPTTGSGYNYNIYWVEENNSSNAGSVTNVTGNYTITFPHPGTYQVEITGQFPRIYFNNEEERNKIVSIEQWGDIVWKSMANAFSGCEYLQIYATDAPDLSDVTDMSFMFYLASNINQDLNHWDVSNISNMIYLFNYAINFNGNISDWDVGQVERFQGMFRQSHNFNQNISGWDVSGAWDFQDMFSNAYSFDFNLGNWDMSNALSMVGMLQNSGLSTTNYDATLIGWASADNTPINITLGANGLTYCNAVAEHQSLIENYYWTIHGDALESEDCSPFVVKLITESADTLTIQTFPTDAVQQLKQKINDLIGIDVELQRLVYEGDELQDGYTLQHYMVVSGGYIHLFVNYSPTVVNPIPDQIIAVNEPFNFQFDDITFIDMNEDDILEYSAKKSDGNDLPSWLSFISLERRFMGTPGLEDVGSIDIEVTALDGNGNMVTDTFTLSVYGKPEVVISSKVISPTNQSFQVNIEFNTPVTGFSMTDILFVNATSSNFEAQNDTEFSVIVQPLLDGEVSIQIPENAATDENDIPNLASNMLVMIYDGTPPHVVTKDATVYLDEMGTALLTPDLIDNGSSDAFGIASMELSHTQFNCDLLGISMVQLTVTDSTGNTASAYALVTVLDTIAPTPDLSTLPVVLSSNQINAGEIAVPTAFDQCSGVIIATTETIFPITSQGNTFITWTYEDASGNQSSQIQKVQIHPGNAPEIQCHSRSIISCDSIVTFDLPEASDSFGPVEVIQTDRTGLTSGSVFPAGKTTLIYQATNAAGTSSCTLTIEVLPPLEIQHIAGISTGDTLHIADCISPPISIDDLHLGLHQTKSRFVGRKFQEEMPATPQFGLWNILQYAYEVHDQCGNREIFRNYVALYDLNPPTFQYFPRDTIIASTSELPAPSEQVIILDICRYVVWDTIITSPILDEKGLDTLAFVRRWIAEDVVGNKSYRDQMIYIQNTPNPGLNNITAHIITEEDLAIQRFPQTAGTDSILVTLYKLNQTTSDFTPIWTMRSDNWMGQRGRLFYDHLLPGKYQIKIDLPSGYQVFHPDSIVLEHGWSDTLFLAGDTSLDLGTILLIQAPDTTGGEDTTTVEAPPMPNEINTYRAYNRTLRVFPNPTMDVITVDFEHGGLIRYSIYNHLGQFMANGITAKGKVIDMRGFNPGIYFLKLHDDHQFLGTERIILTGASE